MANNQNFIVKHGLTVGGNQYVIDAAGNWIGPQTAYANASFATANIKSHVYAQDTSPSTANVGDFWIDSSNGIEYLYTSSNSANIWVEYGPVGSPTGNIIFSDQTLIGNIPNRDITLYPQGTGNINLSFATTVTANLHSYSGQDDIGTVFFPYKNIYLQSGGISLQGFGAANPVVITNDANNVVVQTGGLKVLGGTVQANAVPFYSHFYGVNIESQLVVANSIIGTTNAVVRIVGSTNGQFQPAVNPGYMIHITGQDNTPSRIVNDGFGVGAMSVYVGRTARGNTTHPQAVQANDVLSRFVGSGYGSTTYPQYGSGRMDIVSTETHTDLTKGTHIEFWATPSGSNTLVQIATFNGQTVEFRGNVVSNTAHQMSYFHDIKINGNISVNTAIFASNTTQYVDYSNIGMLLVDVATTTTFSHLNLVAGSIVEVIAHNNTGADHTVNLTVPALNCTATRDKNGKYNAPANTLLIYAGTTASYKFTSFKTALANVYCVITPT